jgi:hypothetical protein
MTIPHREPKMPRSEKRTMAAMLKQIGTFMADHTIHSSERRGLWAVLTGLRGPDNLDWTDKDATTSVIRGAALGYDAVGRYANVTTEDHLGYRDRREKLRRGADSACENLHFVMHAKDAFRALGLKWEENNGVIRPIKPGQRSGKR